MKISFNLITAHDYKMFSDAIYQHDEYRTEYAIFIESLALEEIGYKYPEFFVYNFIDSTESPQKDGSIIYEISCLYVLRGDKNSSTIELEEELNTALIAVADYIVSQSNLEYKIN